MKKFILVMIIIFAVLITVIPVGCVSKGNAVTSTPWTITITDSKGKSVEFTGKDAGKLKIEQISATLKKKDGSEVLQNWKGVLLSDVLKASGITEFNKIKVIATDGYEQVFEPAVINDSGTILGLMLDGKEITVDEGLVQLVVKSMGGNSWVRNIKSIVVE